MPLENKKVDLGSVIYYSLEHLVSHRRPAVQSQNYANEIVTRDMLSSALVLPMGDTHLLDVMDKICIN
jgi:hypothetical protein